MCAITIEEALTKVDGVKNALVDMDALTVTVAYDIDKTGVKSLESAISNAEYQANGITANLEANKTLPKCCKLPADR